MIQSISPFTEAYIALRSSGLVIPARMLPTPHPARQVLDFLGNPQDAVPVIHVAGISAKRPVALRIAQLLQAGGKRVGYAPHQSNEQEAMADFLRLVHRAGVPLTNDELRVVFWYWRLARELPDVVVVRAGTGGSEDATNVVTRADKVCVISDVAPGQIPMVGAYMYAAADQVMGIIQPRNAVFCVRQAPEDMAIIQRHAQQKQADLHVLPVYQEQPEAVARWVLGQER
jgi:dihydrofolate synthase/folylpolyglutamate synthase